MLNHLASILGKDVRAHSAGRAPIARETNFRAEAMTSHLAPLAIVDALIACLTLGDYERSVKTLRKTFEVLSLKRY